MLAKFCAFGPKMKFSKCFKKMFRFSDQNLYGKSTFLVISNYFLDFFLISESIHLEYNTSFLQPFFLFRGKENVPEFPRRYCIQAEVNYAVFEQVLQSILDSNLLYKLLLDLLIIIFLSKWILFRLKFMRAETMFCPDKLELSSFGVNSSISRKEYQKLLI